MGRGQRAWWARPGWGVGAVPMHPARCRSCVRSLDETADLHQVVGEDAVSAPRSRSVESVEACSVEPEVAFRAADPSFAAGAPAHHPFEGALVLDLATRRGRLAFGGQHDVTHPGGAQIVLDAGFAVASIGGHRSRGAPGATADP